ncbi:MAG: helix-turn-helix domain-containing protein [Hyphomicrobiales bacterium]|nr:helix-turn-helix domain-containing protein [Hyphomicrobiales bacterium]MBV8662549.1 helix-turn-helix domain-containing protein [Hyphomicrobiales bacterium]
MEKTTNSDSIRPHHDAPETIEADVGHNDAGPQTQRASSIKALRREIGLTQEEFCTRFRIPLGTLRDWEQGRSEPDKPARAYLTAIAGDAAAVSRALEMGAQ